MASSLFFNKQRGNVDDALCLKKTISFRTEDIEMATNQRPNEKRMIRYLSKEYFFTYKSQFFFSRAFKALTRSSFIAGPAKEKYAKKKFLYSCKILL